MTSARWLSRSPRRPAAPRRPGTNVRPTLEPLEDRVVLATVTPTVAVTVDAATYDLFLNQTETVHVAIGNPSGLTGVKSFGGTVNITDNGVTHTGVPVDQFGNAQSTFTFNYPGLAPGAHTVTALYSGFTDSISMNTLAGSLGTGTAPDTTSKYNTVVVFDILLILYAQSVLNPPQ